jgi:hypothetical protein
MRHLEARTPTESHPAPIGRLRNLFSSIAKLSLTGWVRADIARSSLEGQIDLNHTI